MSLIWPEPETDIRYIPTQHSLFFENREAIATSLYFPYYFVPVGEIINTLTCHQWFFTWRLCNRLCFKTYL